MTHREKALYTKFNLLLKGSANVQDGSIKICNAVSKPIKVSLQPIFGKKTSFSLAELVLLAKYNCN